MIALFACKQKNIRVEYKQLKGNDSGGFGTDVEAVHGGSED